MLMSLPIKVVIQLLIMLALLVRASELGWIAWEF